MKGGIFKMLLDCTEVARGIQDVYLVVEGQEGACRSSYFAPGSKDKHISINLDLHHKPFHGLLSLGVYLSPSGIPFSTLLKSRHTTEVFP